TKHTTTNTASFLIIRYLHDRNFSFDCASNRQPVDSWFTQGEKMRTIQYRRQTLYGRNREALGATKPSLDEFASQVLEIKIVLTGVFDDVGIRHQTRLLLHRPRLRINLGVVNCNLNVQVPEVHPPETLGDMQRFGSRLTCLIQPCLSVEATRF